MTQMLPLDALPATGVDEKTAALLQLVSGDRIHAADRAKICRAVVAEANSNGGRVDPNRLRARLSDANGHLTVYPRCVGAVMQALAVKGALTSLGWVTCSGSTSGNNGKPQRAYRLVDTAAAS